MNEATGSAAAVAAALSAHFGREIGRQQVWTWARRGTLNRLGQAFPDAARLEPGWRTRGKVPVFTIRKVIDWAEPGVPGPRGRGWTDLVTGGQLDGPAQRGTFAARREAGITSS